MLIDSHCHLDYFTAAELPDVLARAAAAGVGEMVTIGTTLAQSRAAAGAGRGARRMSGAPSACIRTTPRKPRFPTPETLAALTRHPKVIGIGESGLDYFYDRAPRDVQQENFRAHIRAARLAGLPLAIHARDADADIARSCKKNATTGGDFAFLLHCFSSVARAGRGGDRAGRLCQLLRHPDLPEIH